MNKKIQKIEQFGVTFTEEESAELGIKEGDKFSVSLPEEDGSIKLTPYKEIEIEFEDFSRDELVALISASCEQDISINEVIENILREFIDRKSESIKRERDAEDAGASFNELTNKQDEQFYIIYDNERVDPFVVAKRQFSEAILWSPSLMYDACLSLTKNKDDATHYFDKQAGGWRAVL